VTSVLLRSLEHVHGHLGWLSALALCHPAVLLRRRRRSVLLAAAAASALVTVCGCLGALSYPSYRVAVKPGLFAASAWLGMAFERKEHLGVAVVVLSWVGLVAHWAAVRERGTNDLWRVAVIAYTSAAVLAILSASLGTAVAVHGTF